ncbi:hypothetical protein BO82DRAFT_407696 [Aspergillus uvarum CBS 121591]|uniref:Uncharacterized protein n=1 Tax=Aspergillus uvarum CBS 121591 TaxID=1448315 RepID=A0A319BWQ7_9EURO|nr:hypothetical protein BO82DRAFT_407696 [Aspergillus uvarum CBS 121591]PYH75790.1 hypothetical protein BO82DRAFT_407696 [Aspergillus uvarum CBS 121591]
MIESYAWDRRRQMLLRLCPSYKYYLTTRPVLELQSYDYPGLTTIPVLRLSRSYDYPGLTTIPILRLSRSYDYPSLTTIPVLQPVVVRLVWPSDYLLSIISLV